MARYLVRKKKNRIDTIRLKKGFDLRNSTIKGMLDYHKKQGYKMVTAKSASAARKSLVPKGYTTRKIRKK